MYCVDVTRRSVELQTIEEFAGKGRVSCFETGSVEERARASRQGTLLSKFSTMAWVQLGKSGRLSLANNLLQPDACVGVSFSGIKLKNDGNNRQSRRIKTRTATSLFIRSISLFMFCCVDIVLQLQERVTMTSRSCLMT